MSLFTHYGSSGPVPPLCGDPDALDRSLHVPSVDCPVCKQNISQIGPDTSLGRKLSDLMGSLDDVLKGRGQKPKITLRGKTVDGQQYVLASDVARYLVENGQGRLAGPFQRGK